MGNLYIQGLMGSLTIANYLCPVLLELEKAFKGDDGPNFHINRLYCDTQYYQMDHLQVESISELQPFPVYLYGLITNTTGKQMHAKTKSTNKNQIRSP